MRRLRPNSRGVLVPTKTVIRTGGHVNPYHRPSQALQRIDRMREGLIPRIAVTRKQGGIGDVLMTLPTVKAISGKYNTVIDYGTDFDYLDGALVKVLQGNPYIRKVVPWREIEGEDYDAVIDFTCPCVKHEVPRCVPINRVDLFANHAAIKLHNHDIDYYVTDEEQKWAEEYIEENNLSRRRLILVQPSSSSLQRDAPVIKMKRALANVLSLRRDVRALVITHYSDQTKEDWNFSDIHVLHDFDVRQIAAIMTQCQLVVCPDSAVLHLAAALHQPTVTLFGPTDPNARINYHPEAVAIWPGKELVNYPIWWTESTDGYLCWKRLEEEVIVKTILAVLEDEQLPQSRDLVTCGSLEMESQHYQIV